MSLPPVRVWSISALMERLDDHDTVTVKVPGRSAGGKQAIITNSRRATCGYDQRVEGHRQRGHGDFQAIVLRTR